MQPIDILGRISFGKYPYLAARMRAMKSKLLTRIDYEKILKMDLYTMAKFLEDRGYPIDEEILREGFKVEDMIELAANESLESCFRKLLFITAGQTRKIILAYVVRYDIENIKTLLRGKLAGENIENLRNLWVCGGLLSKEKLEELYMLDDIQEIFRRIKLLKMDRELKEAIDTFNTEKRVDVLENVIDKRYFNFLLKYSQKLQKDGKTLLQLIKIRFDVLNLRTLYRLKREGAGKEEIMKWVYPSGLKLKMRDIERLAAAPDLKSLHEMVMNTPYGTVLDGVDISESLIEVELRLDTYLLNFASTLMHTDPISIVPVIAYLMMKEAETSNIKLIARGKARGVNEDFIKKYLVIYS